jgi:hypothetical protein
MSRVKRTTPKQPGTEWESPRDTAAATGESVQTIYNKIGLGCFDARKSSSRTLVNVASRRKYYNSLPKARIAPPRTGKSLEAAE